MPSSLRSERYYASWILPYASWILNTSEARWHSPIGDAPDLTDEEKAVGTYYAWNEDGQSWDKETP